MRVDSTRDVCLCVSAAARAGFREVETTIDDYMVCAAECGMNGGAIYKGRVHGRGCESSACKLVCNAMIPPLLTAVRSSSLQLPAVFLKASLMTMLALTLQGCATLAYYLQSANGQMEVLAKRRPIATIIADDRQDPSIREGLRLVEQLRRFAVEELALPDNGSYRSYSDLGRPYVIYNVFATPELSMEPVRSCFPFVGCLDYRGYFSERMARAHAQSQRAKGYDVFVGGVAAYSTLGWFDDPVLNSMLRWDEAHTARFIFHELAHQRLYVKNDTAFNEAFAETVAERGLERWLQMRVDASRADVIRRAELREEQFIAIVLSAKSELERAYAATWPDTEKRAMKHVTLERLRRNYQQLKLDWGGVSSYDAWIANDLNNAKISAVVTYNDDIPAFRALLQRAAGDMPQFYELAERVGRLSAERRRACIEGLKRDSPGAWDACLFASAAASGTTADSGDQ
jgi:predicted aminopeptidase